ncbi:MAG: tetratricopeptide repeat protein [Chitinispirillales bacterium]|jgi:tetratricopeptide (TPR) repeat protein|nr:tetratricopeptide repeat protein [Chitinispirillales bacterium]
MILDNEWSDLPDLLDKVQELLDLGLFDDAHALLDKYKSAFQDYWELHFLYSRVYTEQNLPRKAIPCLMTGLRLDRGNADCLLGLFYAFAMMGKIWRGGRFLIEAHRLHPENELVVSALIWYYTEINEAESAVECFEIAKELNSNNPETYRNGGLAFDRLGRFEEAEACYKAALLISPNFDEARDLYADHLIFTGKAIEAVKLYEEALRESPKNIRHMSKLIYCLSQRGEFDRAESMAQHSISLYPNSPVGYLDLAYVNLNTGHIDGAAENAEKAISISPIDAEGYRVLAIASSERGDYEAAEKLFEKAISIDPDNADALRDYYQHLRVAGKFEPMLDIVNKTIKLEYPYCTEDYWFLADYYRERKQNSKAFRYLRLAYNSMPAEKELLPPMIEILLEQGHTKYSLPIFANYVQRSGWTDAMSNFTLNRQFKDRVTQEGIRFLRFTGQRPRAFREYIFKYYMYRFGLMYYTLLAAALAFPAGVLLGWIGVGGVAAAYGTSLGVIKVMQAVRFRRAVAKAIQAAQTAQQLRT